MILETYSQPCVQKIKTQKLPTEVCVHLLLAPVENLSTQGA